MVFNRPEVVRRLLSSVRARRPPRVFVAADGPRPDHGDDVERCAETRALIEQIDWPCAVTTLYRDTNLGLQSAVVSALDWFFEHVDTGIVLEDDCIPEPDFFPFAGAMLERYRDVPRVMHVSGLNMRPEETFGPGSYFFASVGHIWGWATWRRAWRRFDGSLPWPTVWISGCSDR